MPRPKGSRNKPKDQPMRASTTTAERTENEAVAGEATSQGEVAVFQPPRLPYHERVKEAFGVDKGQWKVLVEAIYPAAKTVDAIVMALTYCKSRNLDPFKRPVHIVPMWDSARGAYVETVWPGISELRTTASRTKGYAGCEEAAFGKTIKHKFTGNVKERGNWTKKEFEVEFPEWCRITVHRIVDGQKCTFVGPKVRWLETYATQGASELPNKMWQERPEGQLEKCAEAAALRRAFPEEMGNELTAEEMIGRNIHDLQVESHAPEQIAGAANQDAAPPRSAQTAARANDQEQVRDGAPPRRAPAAPKKQQEPPKEDPITTGPQRVTAAAKTAADEVKPHRIPGDGHSFDTWADRYCDLIQTSADLATVYKWIDENSRDFVLPGDQTGKKQTGPLPRLQAGKPSVYARVKKTTEETMDKLRASAEKAAAKNKPAAPPPSDMADEPTGEMSDGPTGENDSDFGEPESDNPEHVLAWVEKTLAAVTAPEDLENVWNDTVAPRIEDLFPPDQQEAQGILRKHEKRLEP